MPNNSYVLNRTRQSFTRPANTTAYLDYSFVSSAAGSVVLMSAPVSDRPFYLRRLSLQILGSISTTSFMSVHLFNADPGASFVSSDNAFLNFNTAATNNLLEGIFSFNYQQGVQAAETLPTNGVPLFCPTGTYAIQLQNGVGWTPTSGQRFTFIAYTEYAN